MTSTTTFGVEGMSCGHCVAAVRTEVSAVPGVTAVEVDLEGASVTVTSNSPLDVEAVRAAVDDAGFTLVP